MTGYHALYPHVIPQESMVAINDVWLKVLIA